MGPGIEPQKRPVVVEHLFEVGNLPPIVDAVAGKPPANLVEESSPGHLAKGQKGHLPVGRFGGVEQEGQSLGMGKLRSPAESSKVAIEDLAKVGEKGLDGSQGQGAFPPPPGSEAFQNIDHLAVLRTLEL